MSLQTLLEGQAYSNYTAGATPDDIVNAINSWGVYGQLSEMPESESNGSRVLNITTDVMLNLLHSVPFVVEPSRIVLQAYDLGSSTVNVQFSQVSLLLVLHLK